MTEPAEQPSIPQWTLADRLRKSLEHAEMAPAEMAQYLEVHRNTVSNWIYGHARPPASAVKLWAMRTGVPYEWLMTGSEPSGSHITALMRPPRPGHDATDTPSGNFPQGVQPGYAEIDNPVTAMRRALGHGQRQPNNRAEKVQT